MKLQKKDPSPLFSWNAQSIPERSCLEQKALYRLQVCESPRKRARSRLQTFSFRKKAQRHFCETNMSTPHGSLDERRSAWYSIPTRRCGGTVDTGDLKSPGSNPVPVRVRPPAPRQKKPTALRFRRGGESSVSVGSFFLSETGVSRGTPVSVINAGSDMDCSGAPFRVFITDLGYEHSNYFYPSAYGKKCIRYTAF